MQSALKVTVNLIIFQLGWFACVLGGNFVAVPYCVAALVIHWRFIMTSGREWPVIIGIAAVGISWDMALSGSGILTFAGNSPFGLPIWLLCLWLLFATTFNHCLAWLQKRLAVAALLGAFFGPAVYWLGSLPTEVQIAQPMIPSLAIMACGWLLLVPAGLWWARRYGENRW